MAGFGSLAPGEDWQDREARANLAAIDAIKPSTATWFDSIRSALGAPGRMVGSLASTPVENADAGAMMPETYVNPLVKGTMDAAGQAIASGATAPGEALAGKIPIYDAEGHTSPEMVRRGFDTAALAGGGGAAGTLSADSAKAGAAVAAAEHAPAFNLTAEEALKNSARKSGTGAQWSNELKRYGAKPEELDWRGATDMLTKNANVPITRATVEQHLASNPFEVKPVEKQQMPANWGDLTREQQYAVGDKYEDITGNFRHGENAVDLPEWYEDIAHHSRQGNESGLDSIFNPPHYNHYQLPGGENYRERLLTLPTKASGYSFRPMENGIGVYSGDDLIRRMPNMDAAQAWARTQGAGERSAEAAGDYKSSHWNEPNVLVHRRTTDRELQNETGAPSKSVHAEEIQSDWHQAGQNKGYRQEGDLQAGLVEPHPDVPGLWQYRFPGGQTVGAFGSEQAARRAMQEGGTSFLGVPNAPFKDSWHRLALNDMIREAAEKGADEISWTAGRSQPTNPKNLNVGGVMNDERRAAYEKAESGLVKHYDEKLVNAANKIGKAHGVSVERGTIPKGDTFTAEQGRALMARDGITDEQWRNMSPADRQQTIASWQDAGHDIFRMKIPQSLKDQALQKGFSLFEDAGPASAAVQLAAHTGEGNVGAKAGLDVGRGVGGAQSRSQRVEAAQRASERVAGTYKPLEGLPSGPYPVGGEPFIPGPIASVHETARQYMKSTGRPYERADRFHPIDPEQSTAIARAFDEMKHEPDNPKVKASYDAMIKETRDQYDALAKSGVKLEAIPPGMADPYAETPRGAAKDVAENNHLWFFPTDQGFGTSSQGGIDMAKHPMMQQSGRELNGKPLLNNDLFRVVHDYFGHLKEGHGFRAAGEDNAWRTHAKMYSEQARPAMTTETRGQNSWVNYGPRGETNRKASAADTKYADQKVGLMPDWTMSHTYPGKPDWQEALKGTAYPGAKYGERYPETAPPVEAIDKTTGKTYMAKDLRQAR